METRRVVITGIGAVTPLGLDMPTTWQGVISGKSGIKRVEGINPEVETFGVVTGFNAEDHLDKKTARRLDRFAQFAIIAAGEALKNAHLEDLLKNPEFRHEIGNSIGTGNGGQITNEEQHRTWLEKGPGRVSAFAVPMIMPNAAAGNVALQYGLNGPALTNISACATGIDSIIAAYKAVRDGDAKVMLGGSADAAITAMVVASFTNMGALVKKAWLEQHGIPVEAASRPFDKYRAGFAMAEGAAVMVLEDLEHAKQRGAKIYAEMAGYWQNNDAHHITSPNTSTQALAIIKALQRAGIGPEEVDYINAHGTSTPQNDSSETAAIKAALGAHAYRTIVSSTKSMVGHMCGAAGSFEAAVTAMAIHSGIIPPTMNLQTPDVENGCDLNYAANAAVRKDINVAVKISFGFGGHNAVLVLRKYQP
ncbi:beta-ketoacyl-ACP synthase II [Candidatus Woesearchaeota archaeon]|nr:beta-ketoacyl-ACP synthase II [Candidatus Woesearchaeota archaeon]